MNFFRTEKFGSKFGDTDDLGMAWGRASFRQYFKAIAIKKKIDNNSRSAAVTMLHWLEGSGKALKFDFDWVFKNSRALDAYNSVINKLSNLNNNSGAKINGNELFDVFGTCTSCNKSYNNSLLFFKNNIIIALPFSYGDFSFDANTAYKKEFNFIRTEKFGSQVGDLDDLGMAWGRTSLRQYVKGNAKKFWNELTNK